MDPLINPRHRIRHTFGAQTRYVQRGQGFFSVFSKVIPTLGALFKRMLPVAKKVASSSIVKNAAKELRNHALDVGVKVGEDLLDGANLKESVKTRGKEAGESFAKQLLNSAKNRKKRVMEDEISREKKLKKTVPLEEGVRLPRPRKKKKRPRRDLFT